MIVKEMTNERKFKTFNKVQIGDVFKFNNIFCNELALPRCYFLVVSDNMIVDLDDMKIYEGCDFADEYFCDELNEIDDTDFYERFKMKLNSEEVIIYDAELIVKER